MAGSGDKDESEFLCSSLPTNIVADGLDRVGICDWP